MSRLVDPRMLAVLAWLGGGVLSPGVMSAELATNASTSWAGPAVTVSVGQPLSEALDALRTDGLSIVYSTALVSPGLRVRAMPPAGSPEARARALLEPHRLALEAMGAGTFVVVRQTAATLSAKEGPASGPSADPAARPEFEQVSIFASRYRIDAADNSSRVDLRRQDIEVLPGLDEDVLRVMRYLPGTATNGVSARANVRGGRDNEIAMYFDGVPLFEPFHFKDYQALLGVLDPGAIGRLDFYSGVFPARFGDRLSGVLDLEPRRSESEGDHHEIGLSLLYAHALSVGEREWRDQSVQWLVSLRHSVVEPALKNLGRSGVEPDFLDGLGRVELQTRTRGRLEAGFLVLNDGLEARTSGESERTVSRYRDGTGWLGWQATSEGGTALRLRIASTERHTDRSGALARPGSVEGRVDDEREFGATTLRLDAQGVGGWTAGFESQALTASYDYLGEAQFDPLLAAVFGRSASFARVSQFDVSGQAWALYGSVLLRPAPRWRLDVGLRADRQRHAVVGYGAAAAGGRFDAMQWSPRLAVDYEWDAETTLRASLGQVSQSERPDELQVLDGEPAFHPAQRATQFVTGLERRLSSRATLRLEAYRKDIAAPTPRYENLLDPLVILPELEVDRRRVAPDRSQMYGAELSLRWQAEERWAGWLTYTRSAATDEFAGVRTPRSWNQRDALIGGVAWTQNPWQLSANLNWHDGWRRSEIAAIPDSLEPDGVSLSLAPRNASTWENYFSLDLRTTWSIPVRWGSLRFYGEINNVTNRGNDCCEAVSLLHSPGMAAQLQRRQSGSLPRYALVGLSWSLP